MEPAHTNAVERNDVIDAMQLASLASKEVRVIVEPLDVCNHRRR